MAKFSSIEKQADKMATAIAKELNDKIDSVGTIRNYQQALTTVAKEMVAQGQHLRDLTPERAEAYLEQRGLEVGQKTLDMERQAIQSMMQNVTGQLEQNEKLTVIKSEHSQVLESRAYTPEQVKAITGHQSPHNALATEIAYSAGLRAHELATIRPIEERAPSERPANEEKFSGREGVAYTVQGKGGLIREVRIPQELSTRLEATRLDKPETVTDRNISYDRHYEIGYGNAFSKSFSEASQKALEFSNGAHGLRHSYAQERMSELRDVDRPGGFLSYEKALETVSQELGHFRESVTEVYLR